MKPKSKGIVSWPKAERPRERLLAEGVEKLTEAELLPREPRRPWQRGLHVSGTLSQNVGLTSTRAIILRVGGRNRVSVIGCR